VGVAEVLIHLQAEAFNDNVVRCASRPPKVLAPASGQIAEEIIDVHQPRVASHDGRCMSRDLEYANMRCCGAIARIAGFKNISGRNC
jgi:hypothetical protein